ncbi:hypothetical protein [Alteromonas sp. CYL-A6]|uniref:hypothetical protein n=1 Tax=Alteromonas nitratireducens TaxID=3390813 RepID=UPI0034AB4B8D
MKFFLLSLLFYLTLVPTQAASYRVGVEDISYYPIMDFSQADGRGLMKDILQTFADSEGIALEFIPLPISRFSTWFDDGAIDLRLPDNPLWSSEQDDALIYSAPILSICQSTVVLAKNRDHQQEQVKTVGTLQGFTPSRHWDALLRDNKVKLVSDPSLRVLTRMLFNDMIDALDLHISAIEHQASLLGLATEELAQLKSLPAFPLTYRLSTKAHPELISRFNRFLTNQRKAIDALTVHYAFDEGCH